MASSRTRRVDALWDRFRRSDGLGVLARKDALYVVEVPTQEAIAQAKEDYPDRLLVIPVKPRWLAEKVDAK